MRLRLTAVAGVATSVVGYALDRVFVLTTPAVLAVLIVSLLLGRGERPCGHRARDRLP